MERDSNTATRSPLVPIGFLWLLPKIVAQGAREPFLIGQGAGFSVWRAPGTRSQSGGWHCFRGLSVGVRQVEAPEVTTRDVLCQWIREEELWHGRVWSECLQCGGHCLPSGSRILRIRTLESNATGRPGQAKPSKYPTCLITEFHLHGQHEPLASLLAYSEEQVG